MKTRVFLLLAAVVLVCAAPLRAQTPSFSTTMGGAWTTTVPWVPSTMPAPIGAFPGANPNNGTVFINAAGLTFTGPVPPSQVTSMSINAVGITTFNMTGTLRLTSGLSISGGTVNIQSGEVVIDGPLSLPSGTVINIQAGAKLTLNSTIVGTGTINTAAATSSIEFGSAFNAGVLPSQNFPNPLQGYIKTSAALSLNAAPLSGNLIVGNAGTLDLGGDLTISNGSSLGLQNTASPAGTALIGTGRIQGQSITASLSFAAGFATNTIPADRIATTFNGRLIVGGGTMTYANAPLVIGTMGGMSILGGTLTPAAAANTMTLNNTAANSFQGPGRLVGMVGWQLTLGNGFNGGILNGNFFDMNQMLGTLITTGALSLAQGGGNLTFPANGTLQVGGPFTIGNGITLQIDNVAAGAVMGTSIQAAPAPMPGVLSLGAGANAGNIPATSIVNPFNGTLQTAGAMTLPAGLTMGAPSVLNLGGNLTLAGAGTSLALNMTAAAAMSLPGTNLIIPVANTAVVLGANAFNNVIPYDRFGMPAGTFPNGSLVVNGTTQLDPAVVAPPNLTIGGAASLVVNGLLTVPAGKMLNMQNTGANTFTGTGLVQANNNTATVNMANMFNGGNIPANRFANPFNGVLQTGGPLNLVSLNAPPDPGANLTMGMSSILNLGGNLTVNSPTTLTLNMTAAEAVSLPGGAQIISNNPMPNNAALVFGTSAFGGLYPVTRVPTGPAGFSGTIGVGANMTFGANYNVDAPTVLRLDGVVAVQSGASLGLRNTNMNALIGTGTLGSATMGATASIGLANNFNGGQIPGTRFTNPFNGTLQTYGPMQLTSAMTIGMSGVLNLSGVSTPPGDLTVNPGVNLTLLSTASGAVAGTGGILGTATSSVTLGPGFNANTLDLGDFVTNGPPASQFSGVLTTADGLQVANCMNSFIGTLNLVGQLNVPAGCQLNLTNTSPGALTGTGTIQAANNTASVLLGPNFSAGQVAGARFAVPFNGTLRNTTNSQLVSNLTMGTGSILQLNAPFQVNNGSQLTMNGTVATPASVASLQGLGTLQGESALASVRLGPNFFAQTLPTANFASPFNGNLIITSPLSLSSVMTIGAPGALTLLDSLIIGPTAILNLNNTGANTLTASANARFVANDNFARISLGLGHNAGLVNGAPFTNFSGIVALSGALTLSSNLTLGTGSSVNFGGLASLTLGSFNVSVTRTDGASRTAFYVTNGTGAVTINSTTVSPYIFHIGTTATAYSPVTLTNTGAPDTFSARVTTATGTAFATAYPGRVNLLWVLGQGSPTGTKNASVTMQWEIRDETGAFDRSQSQAGTVAGSAFLVGASGAATEAGFAFTRTTTSTVALSTATAPSTQFFVATTPPPPPPPLLQPPIVTAVEPPTIEAGVPDVPIVIRGTNFRPGARVEVAYDPSIVMRVSTTSVVPTVILATLPGIARSAPRTLTLRVTNADAAPGTIATMIVTRANTPIITSVTPSSTNATGQPFTATLNGSNFFTNFSFIQVEDTARNLRVEGRIMRATTATQAFVEIPAAFNVTTSATLVRFFNADRQSSVATINVVGGFIRPFIASLSPSSTTAGVTTLTLTINGSGFFSNAIVRFSGQQLTPLSNNGSQIVVVVPRNLLTIEGLPRVEVQNGDGVSAGAVFVIAPPVPVGPRPSITSVVPSSTTASFRPFTIILNGQNFSPRGALFNSQPGSETIVLDSNRIAAFIPALTTSGTVSVGITNPDGQATSATITVGNPLAGPMLSRISPSTTSATMRAFTVIAIGRNFTQGASAFLADSSGRLIRLTVLQNTADTVRIEVPGVTGGSYQLIVLNADGQRASVPFVATTVSVHIDKPLPNVKAFPNPVVDAFTVEGTLDRPLTLTISVTSMTGQRVIHVVERVGTGMYRKQFDLSGAASGVYIVEVSDGERRFVEKITKQ